MAARSFTIGIDFGTNSVRAVVVDCADGRDRRHERVRLPERRSAASCSTRGSRTSRGRTPPTTRRACAQSVPRRARRGRRAIAAFSRDRVIGDRRRHDRLDAAAGRRARAAARARPALARQPRRARLALEGPHSAARGGGDHRDGAARTRRETLAPIGGTYSSEWWWSKIWHCLKVAPEVFDAAASWVELADFVPAVLAGVDAPRDIVRVRLRRGTQGDVLGGLGRAAAEGVPRAARSEAGRRCATGCTTRRTRRTGRPVTCAPSGRRRSGCPPASRSRWAAFDAHYGAVGAGVAAGTLVKIIGTSTCDCASRRRPDRIADIPGICGIVNGSIMPGYYGIEAGQSAVGDLLNWWVEVVCGGGDALHAALSAEAAALRARRVGPARARLEQRQPHDPRRPAADRTARSARRCTRRARRSTAR